MNRLSFEVNFDGLVGPTHHYSGLSLGNLASAKNAGMTSNPRAAALEGLNKMKLLADLGFKQAVLPPHERPHIPTLRAFGYFGSDKNIPKKVFQDSPELLYQYSSAAAMFAANAGLITPSIDAMDERVHITAANKLSQPHRNIEAEMTSRVMKLIFPSHAFFTHHPPLPNHPLFLDEGAANHVRLCSKIEEPGVHLFVYGKSEGSIGNELFQYPPRQTYEAQEAIVRAHQIPKGQVIFSRQKINAINHGVFHNDLISMGAYNLFIYHEEAFENGDADIYALRNAFNKVCEQDLQIIKITQDQIPLEALVNCYLFNSQILKLPEGGFILICPQQCQSILSVNLFLENHLKDPESPIAALHYVNLDQSMRNGGGPACLRLPAVLTQTEIEYVHPGIFLTDRLYERLKTWIETHYREQLSPEDLADPSLIEESQQALDKLTQILDLYKIYDFQQ